MAGDWIPVRDDLASVREVIAIASRLKWDRRQVVGSLIQFWGWAQRETTNGEIVDVDVDACVDTLGLPKNFFDALIHVGWLKETGSGITIPHYDSWLSQAAKARIQKTRRQNNWRNRNNVDAHVDASVDASVDAHVDIQPSTTEQKRTEEKRSLDLDKSKSKRRTTSWRAVLLEFQSKIDANRYRLLEEWGEYRASERRKPISRRSIKGWLEQYPTATALEPAIRHSMREGYQGLFAPNGKQQTEQKKERDLKKLKAYQEWKPPWTDAEIKPTEG